MTQTSVTVRAAYAPRGQVYDFSAPAGSTVAVQGANGEGKSTLLALISGLLRPTTGSIVLEENTVAGPRSWVPPHRRPVATLLQRTELFSHRSVLGNAAYGLRSAGWSRTAARREALVWLERCGVAELASRRAGELSGGQARRVAIARTLATPAEVLLLDEPAVGVDRDALPFVLEAIALRVSRCTCVLVTHNSQVVEVADSQVTLYKG